MSKVEKKEHPSRPDHRDFETRYRDCFIDFGFKVGTGMFIGSMMGTFFLRSARRWPMYIGGGLGFGMACSNCEKSLNEFLLSLDPMICLIKKKP